LAARVPARLNPSEGRRFGLTVGASFLALGAVFWWRGHAYQAGVAVLLGAALSLAGLLVPGRLGPTYRAWMRLAAALSAITTPVFMAVIYFGVLTPVGFLVRLLRGNPLVRPRPRASFWVVRDGATRRRTDMEHQF
jgi:hypothetical protein